MPLDPTILDPTILATAGELTRQVFGNVPPAHKLAFYLLAVMAAGVFAAGVYRRVRLWRRGRPDAERIDWRGTAGRFVRDVLIQRRMRGRPLAGVAHRLLFVGFCVLLVGTLLIAVEHVVAALLGRNPANPVFHKGVYFAVYEMVLDGFGLALVAGCVLLLWWRARRPASVDHHPLDWVVLVALLVAGITGYLVEGLRILHAQTPQPGFSFVGQQAARLFSGLGIDVTAAASWHLAMWWLHAVLTLALLAAFPYTRLLHAVAGAANLAISRREPLGTLALVSIEEVQRNGRVGVDRIADLTRRQLMRLDACVSCGRCQDACPAHEARRPLSPKTVVQDVRAAMSAGDRSLHGGVISAETLWSCTACTACVDVCPLDVRPLELITEMRRHLVAEGRLHGPPAASLGKTQRSGNPWGLAAEDRLDWARGLDVPTVRDNPDFEFLYWVGCAASYDRRVQKVARSVARLLAAAEVNFAVLAGEERCTGESARRMGDEFLFQELAEANVRVLTAHRVRKIVTHCPHCLNSFRHDYPQLGGRYEVVHHSELLADLIRTGKLPSPAAGDGGPSGTVTFHDPCYLARVHGITVPPRDLLRPATEGVGPRLVEMPRNGRQTSCCGAGGGRMWRDDAPDERVGGSRVREALDTGARTVAVGCPFCLIMMTDGMGAEQPEVAVKDVAELLAESLGLESPRGGFPNLRS